MTVYIRSAKTISPQHTFPDGAIPKEPVIYNNLLQNILPDFKSYFEPLERRRMSRLIKSGTACAIEAINNAGIEKPDMIISGTGLGCIEDTEKFLNAVLTSEDSMHTPTAFVQSTHNSIGALIAVKYKCHGYNVLYANKTLSFENALFDAMMHFSEGFSGYILLNGFDEITDENYQLKKRVGLYKSHACSNLDVLKSETPGSIPGEGAASLVLTDMESNQNLAKIDSIEIRHCLKNKADLYFWISEFLAKQRLTSSGIDLVICGKNGDSENDSIYQDLLSTCFSEAIHSCYKHLCGEYDTATAFGLCFGTWAIKEQLIPDHALLNKVKKPIRKVLLYNQDKFMNHSIVVLSQC